MAPVTAWPFRKLTTAFEVSARVSLLESWLLLSAPYQRGDRLLSLCLQTFSFSLPGKRRQWPARKCAIQMNTFAFACACIQNSNFPFLSSRSRIDSISGTLACVENWMENLYYGYMNEQRVITRPLCESTMLEVLKFEKLNNCRNCLNPKLKTYWKSNLFPWTSMSSPHYHLYLLMTVWDQETKLVDRLSVMLCLPRKTDDFPNSNTPAANHCRRQPNGW